MKIDKRYMFFNSVLAIYYILFIPIVIRFFTHRKKYLSKKINFSKLLKIWNFLQPLRIKLVVFFIPFKESFQKMFCIFRCIIFVIYDI